MISLEEDDYIRDLQDRGQTIWIAELSDGTSAYYDDDRPGNLINSSWIRLRYYLQENNLSIKRLRLKFRSNHKLVGEGADGYFFCKQLFGGFGKKGKGFYLTGTLRSSILTVEQWVVPELEWSGSEIREIPENECIILNQQSTVGK